MARSTAVSRFNGGHFTALQSHMYDHQHVGTPQHVIIDRMLSVSFIAALPAGERQQVTHQLQSLIATHPALCNKEIIAFPYRTEVYSCGAKQAA